MTRIISKFCFCFSSCDTHNVNANSHKQRHFIPKRPKPFKKGARSWERTWDLLILFIFSYHHFTAEPQRLPQTPKPYTTAELEPTAFGYGGCCDDHCATPPGLIFILYDRTLWTGLKELKVAETLITPIHVS
jgi:hypothetical protein